MWRELIRELHKDVEPIHDLDPGPEFAPGATPDELETLERQVRARLPSSLKELLGESNGVLVVFGQHLIWTTDEIAENNHQLRADVMYDLRRTSFDQLICFGDAGVDGILFAFPVGEDGLAREEVYAWYPISDELVWKATSLRGYIEGWLGGGLTV
jgi:hypothetical protein